jgi:hypothetical protein
MQGLSSIQSRPWMKCQWCIGQDTCTCFVEESNASIGGRQRITRDILASLHSKAKVGSEGMLEPSKEIHENARESTKLTNVWFSD